MAVLHNRVSRKELRTRASVDPTPRRTVSFYRYTPIQDPQHRRNHWYKALQALNVYGRIYMAHEGVNAQISVPEQEWEAFRQFLDQEPGFERLRLNLAVEEKVNSFFVLDIKVRDKIVADGITDPAFSMERLGKYVDAEGFNRLTEDPDTVVVDMRNYYEYEVGHFDHAIEVPSDTFREQLPMAADMLAGDKNRNIIMYCTGGIRCEKASAWMLHRGFKNVFHLEGGIINYVRQVREHGLENKFLGKNFVFDDRLSERVSDDVLAHCHQCGQPCDTHVNCASDGCHLLFIQCDSCRKTMEGCCSDACKDYMHMTDEAKAQWRQAHPRKQGLHNKSRARIAEIRRPESAPHGQLRSETP